MCGRSRNNYYYLYSKIIKPKSAIHLFGEWQELKGRILPEGQYNKFSTAGKTYVKDLSRKQSCVSPADGKQFSQSDKEVDIIVIDDSDDNLNEVNISPDKGSINDPLGSFSQSSIILNNGKSNDPYSSFGKLSLGKRKSSLSLNKNKKLKIGTICLPP